MKRKIIGILVCTLLIATTLPVATSMTVGQTNDENAGIVSSGNNHPIARFTWRSFGYFPFFIVDGRGSSDGDGRIVKYEWQWDEGGSYQSTMRYPRWFHYYGGNKQPHKVTLKVTDDGGYIDLVTHLVFPRPIGGQKGTFSSTYISKYDRDELLGGNLPENDLQEQTTELLYILRGAGWQRKFHETDGSATEGTFKNDVSTSNFHYHCGHGIFDWSGDFITELALKGWNILPNNGDVRPQDVEDKWNNQCKWVWLHSCHILEDYTLPDHGANYNRGRWATVLNTCHMILGFASKTTLSTSVITDFFYKAMTGMTITQAYISATQKCYSTYGGNPIYGAFIADTEDQADNDHLYGYGTVQPDENPDDGNYCWYKWSCV